MERPLGDTVDPSAAPSPVDVDAGPDAEQGAVRRTVGLDVDRDEAWGLVGTADGLARWLGSQVELDPSEGGALRVVEHDGTVRTGVVRHVDHGRRLSFDWTDADGRTSTVDLTVDDDGPGGSRVTVVEAASAGAGGRLCARLDVGAPAGWDARTFALEVAGLDRTLLVGAAVGAPTV
jgi:uncharacterized protein YndB with AHSA1/START domain